MGEERAGLRDGGEGEEEREAEGEGRERERFKEVQREKGEVLGGRGIEKEKSVGAPNQIMFGGTGGGAAGGEGVLGGRTVSCCIPQRWSLKC